MIHVDLNGRKKRITCRMIIFFHPRSLERGCFYAYTGSALAEKATGQYCDPIP